MAKVFTYDDTGEAYDDCQCNEDVQNGDTLVVAEESWRGNKTGTYDDYGFPLYEHEDNPVKITVVGLAWAWPIAVTVQNGNLHQITDEAGALERIMVDAKWSDDAVRQACTKAVELGAELHQPFADWMKRSTRA